MTVEEYSEYYANLLILQYKTLAKAREHIKLMVKTAYANGVMLDLLDGFNIDTAKGKQLDILGQYIGISRNVKTILEDGSTVLNDDQYRLVLKLKLVTNCSFSSTSSIITALYELFGNEIRLYDNRDMTYEYFVSTAFESVMGVIVAEKLFPLPMGVGYTVIVVSDYITRLYGYSSYSGINDNPNGYSSYKDGWNEEIYLSYAYDLEELGD